MHYGTNPLAKGTVAEFEQALGAGTATKIMPLVPGVAVQF